MKESELFGQVSNSTEYESICDLFSTVSDLFIQCFSLIGNLPTSELESFTVDKKIKKSDLQRRLKENKKANGIMNEIKRILTVGTPENPSLETRIRNYINRNNNRLINIDIANHLTQSIVSSLVYVFQLYQINKYTFDNTDVEYCYEN